MLKRCKICQKEFPLEQFRKNAKEADGYERVCKQCRADKVKLARLIERERNSTLTEALDTLETIPVNKNWKPEPVVLPKSEGPCRRCHKSTFDWHPAEPYGDPQDVIHLCPECWKILLDRVKWVATKYLDEFEQARRDEEFDRLKAERESSEFRAQINQQNQTLEAEEAQLRLDPKNDERCLQYWMQDGLTTKEQAERQRALFFKSQEEMEDGAPPNLD